jgi:hypothetical protein
MGCDNEYVALFVVVAGFAASVAFNIQLEDCRIMNEPVYSGDDHRPR